MNKPEFGAIEGARGAVGVRGGGPGL